MQNLFSNDKVVNSLQHKNFDYPLTIALNNSAVKQIFPKYPISRKCNSCGQAAGWHVIERPAKTHIAADIKCNACGKVNGFASPTQWLRLQIVNTRLNGGVA